jgi:4a-hydroxytetrahydrobiopterin dehydratase
MFPGPFGVCCRQGEDVKTIGEVEARERLASSSGPEAPLSGWELDGQTIRRKFTFAGFPDALAFVVRVGFDAESVDHHPDILVNYKRVTLSFTTHSAGGLTEKDFAGAAKATGAARLMGGA